MTIDLPARKSHQYVKPSKGPGSPTCINADCGECDCYFEDIYDGYRQQIVDGKYLTFCKKCCEDQKLECNKVAVFQGLNTREISYIRCYICKTDLIDKNYNDDENVEKLKPREFVKCSSFR